MVIQHTYVAEAWYICEFQYVESPFCIVWKLCWIIHLTFVLRKYYFKNNPWKFGPMLGSS
jgi:hypothetical protein